GSRHVSTSSCHDIATVSTDVEAGAELAGAVADRRVRIGCEVEMAAVSRGDAKRVGEDSELLLELRHGSLAIRTVEVDDDESAAGPDSDVCLWPPGLPSVDDGVV